MSDTPRLLRPVGPPLGLYFRPARNDHTPLMALMAERRTDMSGLVLDACLWDRHAEMRAAAQDHELETVLDPRTVELSMPGGITRSGVTDLPWAGDELPHSPELLGGLAGDVLIELIVKHVAEKKFTAVLAPTHYLAAGRTDPWTRVDADLTTKLRDALDAAGLHDVCIYYPLALPAKLFANPIQRNELIAILADLPVDAVWLRIHPFGTTSAGPLALRRHIEACRDFHQLDAPLVAEHTGTVGLALLAFGAVGGIEGGITFGERYDVNGLLNPPKKSDGFSLAPRVYVERLGAFMKRDQAIAFFENRRMKSLFACDTAGCCARGSIDMTGDPRRHFILRRTGEVARYSRAPEPLRSGLYLEEFLRPATDLALRAAQVAPELDSTRRRLEGWRNTLGAMQQQGKPSSFAIAPQGQRAQRRPAVGE